MKYALLLLPILFTSCFSINCIQGEGEVTSRSLELNVIRSIEIDCSADVILAYGTEQKVKVKGQSNLIDMLSTEMDGSKWSIDFDESVCYDREFVIHITSPEINEITIDGSGDVSGTSPIHTDELELNISGSGDISLDVNTKELEANINGSGGIALSGFSNELSIEIRGSGNVDSRDLKAIECEIDIQGSGDSFVTVRDALDVSINGSGNVSYHGDPKEMKTSTNGSGNIIKL